MSRLNLTSWQRRRLRRQLAETRDARLYRRTLAVLEFDHGRSAADIARMLGVTRQSVYAWVEAYTQDYDPASLEDEGGRGRHPLLDEDQEHLLEALLAVSPQDLGSPHVSWTVPLLQEVLEIATEQWVSDDTLRRALDRLNYVWKRPRYDLDPDPEREKKTPHPQANSGSAAAQRRVGPGRDRPVAVPAVCAAWSKRGEDAKVWLSGRNARRVIFGAMNLRTGTRLFVPREKGAVATFRHSSGKFGCTTGAGMWPCCSMRYLSHGQGLPARGRGNDAVVVAETVAEVEPDGYSVGTGQGRSQCQQAIHDH